MHDIVRRAWAGTHAELGAVVCHQNVTKHSTTFGHWISHKKYACAPQEFVSQAWLYACCTNPKHAAGHVEMAWTDEKCSCRLLWHSLVLSYLDPEIFVSPEQLFHILHETNHHPRNLGPPFFDLLCRKKDHTRNGYHQQNGSLEHLVIQWYNGFDEHLVIQWYNGFDEHLVIQWYMALMNTW